MLHKHVKHLRHPWCACDWENVYEVTRTQAVESLMFAAMYRFIAG